MQERTTFLHDTDHVLDPQQIQLENDSLRVNSLAAARQDRVRLSWDELPQEVSDPKAGLLAPSTLVDLSLSLSLSL